MTHFNMYWFTRLDYIQDLGCWGMTFIVIGLIVSAIMCGIEEEYGPSKKFIKWAIVPLVISLALLTFVPNQKEAAAIWLVPKMVNNEQFNNVAKDTLSILEKHTQLYLKELVEPENDPE